MTPDRESCCGVAPLQDSQNNSEARRHAAAVVCPRMFWIMKVAFIAGINVNFAGLRAYSATYDDFWVIGGLVHSGPTSSEVLDCARTDASYVVIGNHGYAPSGAIQKNGPNS